MLSQDDRLTRAFEEGEQRARTQYQAELSILETEIPTMSTRLKEMWVNLLALDGVTTNVETFGAHMLSDASQKQAEEYQALFREYVTAIRKYIKLCNILGLPSSHAVQKEVGTPYEHSSSNNPRGEEPQNARKRRRVVRRRNRRLSGRP